MSRKSLSKKDLQSTWCLCEMCNINLMTRDRQQHLDHHHQHNSNLDNFDPGLYSKTATICYIYENTFYSNSIELKPNVEELTDLPVKQLNNFVFISECVLNQCHMILNSFVVITPIDKQIDNKSVQSSPIIRCVWPLPDKFGTPIYVTDEELRITWALHKKLSIRKLTSIPIPTDLIVLESLDPPVIDDLIWNDLKLIIAKQMKSMIYCCTNTIYIEFFNKMFRFTIKELHNSKQNTNILQDDLANQLEELQIEEKFYIITSETKYQLYKKPIENCNELDFASCTASNSTTADAINNIECETIIKNPIKLIGGLTAIINDIKNVINLAIGFNNTTNNALENLTNFQMFRSILLYGVPGSGKTLLCNALQFEYQNYATIIKFNASNIFSKLNSESNLMQYFDKAFNNYPKATIIIIEEITSICGGRSDTKTDTSKRLYSTFLNALDNLHEHKNATRTFLLATTSTIESLSLAVRRFGRIDMEIQMPIPNPMERKEIFINHLENTNIPNNLTIDDLSTIANTSHGYIGSDLVNLLTTSIMHTINRNKSDATNATKALSKTSSSSSSPTLTLEMIDINYALTKIYPSAMKEVQLECPNVKWSDIGGQMDLKLQLKQAIEWPLLYPEKFIQFGINPPRGILMFGPPGCSKTLIAKALATESKLNFISIKGPELFSMWVGESERAVRELFRKARQVAPAIIFFDEIDAIGGERSPSSSGNGGGGSSVKERVLAQILTEIDGVHALNGVTIVAATNRPDLIDKALMRPGRIDRIVYVRLPDEKTRHEIFEIKLKRVPINVGTVDISELVRLTAGYSGAEIQAVCQEAALIALQDNFSAIQVDWSHFQSALNLVLPRTSTELLNIYEEYVKKF